MMRLTRDFVEFVECCERNRVRYLIVGGYALSAHGLPRATKDLDVWIMVDPENAQRVVASLNEFGMAGLGLVEGDFLESDVVVQLGYPPIRIDLLTSASGVSFDACWPRRVLVDIGGMEAPFISVDDLIINKRATARPQDLVDVSSLEQLLAP